MQVRGLIVVGQWQQGMLGDAVLRFLSSHRTIERFTQCARNTKLDYTRSFLVSVGNHPHLGNKKALTMTATTGADLSVRWVLNEGLLVWTHEADLGLSNRIGKSFLKVCIGTWKTACVSGAERGGTRTTTQQRVLVRAIMMRRQHQPLPTQLRSHANGYAFCPLTDPLTLLDKLFCSPVATSSECELVGHVIRPHRRWFGGDDGDTAAALVSHC